MKLLSFLLLLLIINAGAQVPAIRQWDKTFGGNDQDLLTGFITTTDGGYLLAGLTESDSLGNIPPRTPPLARDDYLIIKTDSSGNLQWTKRFGTNHFDILNAVCKTTDGGYLLAGNSHGGISGDKTEANRGFAGSSDYWIIKIDSLGNKLWDKTYGGPASDMLNSVLETSDKGFFLAGYSESGIGADKSDNLRGLRDYWVVKVDSLGSKEWDKTYGGDAADMLYTVKATDEGGFLLCGASWSAISGEKSEDSRGGPDYWLIKIDSLGNKLWDRRFGGSGGEIPYNVISNNRGGYLVFGFSDSGISGDKTEASRGDYDYWLVNLDGQGNKVWDKRFGGTYRELGWVGYGTSIEMGLIATAEGNFLLSGTSVSNASGDKTENNLGAYQSWLLKIDTAGNKIWDKTIFVPAQSSDPYAVITNIANDGCYVLAASTIPGTGAYKQAINVDTTHRNNDFWLIKLCDTATTAALFNAQAALQNPTCAGFCNGRATIKATYGASPYNYFWNTNQSTDSITNVCAGSYTVTITDALNNSIVRTVSITDPAAPTANAVANPPVFCPGDSSLVCSATSNYTYLWNTNDTTSCIRVSLPASYTVTVTDVNGCIASSAILVGTYPSPSVSISVNADTLMAFNGFNYQWYLNDSIIEGATHGTYITKQPGNYSVAITDSNGCKAKSTDVVVSGVLNIEPIYTRIFPNPATNFVTVDYGFTDWNKGEVSLEITNELGQLVHQQPLPMYSGFQKIEVENFAPGMYTAFIKRKGQVVGTAKFARQ